MDTIFRGDLATPRGRTLAWVDALVVDHGMFRLFWSNLAVVAPGRLYRCNHPPPGRLARLTHRLGLRTLINLRGEARNGSDALSRDAAARLGLDFIDMPFQSHGAPQRDRILQLHEVHRTMRVPALMHCKSGADRAGLAAGLFLLFEGSPASDALAQLSWRFGHLRRSRAGILDAFFLQYQRDGEGQKPFLQWVLEDYSEVALARDFRAKGLSSFVNDWMLARE